MTLKTHLGKVTGFFFNSLSSRQAFLWVTWCETACVHFSLSHQLKETLLFYLNQQILTLTTQTRVRFHVLLLSSKSAQLFTFNFLLYSSKQCW